MKPYLQNFTLFFLLGFLCVGCIKDDPEDCPEIDEAGIITVAPNYVELPYIEQIPVSSERLTVTTTDINGLADQTIPWSLSLREANTSWLQLTLDATGLTNTGTSVSGTGSNFVYLVAQENTTSSTRTANIYLNEDTIVVTVMQEAMIIEVAPPTILLTGVPHIPAVQTVSVTSNAPWTLTSNQPWLLLSLNENGSDSSATVSSFGDKIVYLVAEGNGDDNARIARIYLNDILSDVRVTVTQESLIAELGQAAPRIFIQKPEGAEGDEKLMLTKSPTNYGALFQYGSVIGWNWNSVTADYNPTNDLSLNNWNINWNNGNKNVEHTYAELMQGRGDPCRLVGYKQTEIKTALIIGRLPDNKIWKLPSNAENIVFGSPPSTWTSINGTPGRVVAESGNPTGVFLPAAGRKIAESGIYGQRGNMGFYITSSIEIVSNFPYMLFFNEQTLIESDNRDGQPQGFSVRCIRQ